MPSGTNKFCQVCAQSGRRSRLKLYQINFNEAIQLCENKTCSFPLEVSSRSSSIQQRDLSSVPILKRKSSSTRSVKSAFSTPFGTPTVLSPVSFPPYTPQNFPKPVDSNGIEPFVNSLLNSDSASVYDTPPLVNGNIEELDLEGLLNSGAFDEPVKTAKNNCVVNGFKEPLPLKTQNPPTNILFSDCIDFSKKYVTKSPKSLSRNLFDDILDIDENTNVFPFDSEVANPSSAVSFTNGLDFHQVTNGFDSYEEKHFVKFEEHLNSISCNKLNNSLCSQDSESALDAEVRSIFESSQQLFEKNNLWSNFSKDKMMAPIKDKDTADMEEDPAMSQASVQVGSDAHMGSGGQTDDQTISVETHERYCSQVRENMEQSSDNDGGAVNNQCGNNKPDQSHVDVPNSAQASDKNRLGHESVEQLPLCGSKTQATSVTSVPQGEIVDCQTREAIPVQNDSTIDPDKAGAVAHEDMITEQGQVVDVHDTLNPDKLGSVAHEDMISEQGQVEDVHAIQPLTEDQQPVHVTTDIDHADDTQMQDPDLIGSENVEVGTTEIQSVDITDQNKFNAVEDSETSTFPSVSDAQIVPVDDQACEDMEVEPARIEVSHGQDSCLEENDQNANITTDLQQFEAAPDVPEAVKVAESVAAEHTLVEENVCDNAEAMTVEGPTDIAVFECSGPAVNEPPIVESSVMAEPSETDFVESDKNEKEVRVSGPIQSDSGTNVAIIDGNRSETLIQVSNANETELHGGVPVVSGVSYEGLAVPQEAGETGSVIPNEELQSCPRSEVTRTNESIHEVTEEIGLVSDQISDYHDNIIPSETQVMDGSMSEVVESPNVEESDKFSMIQGSESVVTTTEMIGPSEEAVYSVTTVDNHQVSINSEQFVNIVTHEQKYQHDENHIVQSDEISATESSEISVEGAVVSSSDDIHISTVPSERMSESVVEDSVCGETENENVNTDCDGSIAKIQHQTDPSFITVSQNENIISPLQCPDGIVTETYKYSNESEIIKSVDDAQPFQTIENVPILEQEVHGVAQTFETVSVNDQQHQFENVMEEMVDTPQSDLVQSAELINQEQATQVSLNGMNVYEQPEGVVVSLPEQTVISGDLQHQMFTVPLNSGELPSVTQPVEFTGVDHTITQQSDYMTPEGSVDTLSDLTTEVPNSGLGTSQAITTQGMILQTSDGVVYTLPQTAIPTMPITEQGGVFTITSQAAPDLGANLVSQSDSSNSTEMQQLQQAPIFISDSSMSLSANTVQLPAEQTSVPKSLPTVTTLGQTYTLNVVRDASNVAPASTEVEEASKSVPLEVDDSGPVQILDKNCLNLFVQWQNKDAMCWLDVVMIVLCNSPTIQKLFTDDLNAEALDNSVLSTLLKAYYQAQTLMQKLTNKVHTDYKENLAKNSTSTHEVDVNLPKTDASMVNEAPLTTTDSSQSGSEPLQNEGCPVSNTSGSATTTVATGAERTEQPAKIKTTTVVNKISVKSMQDYFKAMDILDAVREKIWNVLQPRLQCERGKNDSPLFALPLLVREPAILKEKFKIKFKYTFNCDQCMYHQEDDHSKILPSFPEVPADFNMIEPSFVRNCFQCKTPGKRMKMTFASIPDMLLLHFKEGLPHCRLNELCFTFGGETYTVTAVIQYKNNPDHFVAWIRNGTGDQWMECDDLKSTLCQFITQEPAIPPNQIHIIMWEKNIQPDAARDLEETSACNILQSCLRVLQPDILPGTSVVLPGKEALAQGLKRKAESANQNTVKYILSQAQGGKVPGIITLPAGATVGGMQAMKIVSLPSASSASGLLANVAGLTSATSAGQLLTGSQLLQGTSTYKPVILQSKTRPTILSSIVSSSATGPNIYQQVAPTKTSAGLSPAQQATAVRVIKSGNKVLYLPLEKTASNPQLTAQTVLGGQVVPDSIQTTQIGVSGVTAPVTTTNVSKMPNLKYIQLDKAQFPVKAGDETTASTQQAHLADGSAKTYVVGSDGILQEVPKEASPVKKPVLPTSVQSPASSLPGQIPKIVVRRKNESGEIVQSVVTNLDFKQNSELMKAIESLKNGDAETGSAVIQQLIKGKMVNPGQTSTGSSATATPKQEGVPQEGMKVINVKASTAAVTQSGTASAVLSSPFTAKYVKVGDNIIQIHSSGTSQVAPVGRGRGKGRGQARGGKKKKTPSRPVPIMSNPTSAQKPIDLTSLQTSPVRSEQQCIVISPQGQVRQSGISVIGSPASQVNVAAPQVVKLMSGTTVATTQTGAPIIVGQQAAQNLLAKHHTGTTPTSVQTFTSPGKKVATLLASHLAQGGKKTPAGQMLKAVSVQSSDKSSPVKFILPPSSAQALSPTKSPTSIIMKIPQSTTVSRTVTTLTSALPSQGISITSLGSQTQSLQSVSSVTSPVQGSALQTQKGKIISTGQTVIASQIQPSKIISITPQGSQAPGQVSFQSVTSLLSTSPAQTRKEQDVSSDVTVKSPQMSTVTESSVSLSPVHSPDVEVLSDSEGSKSPAKSPKYNPVISVQAAHGDAALLAKAIQTLVDKGVPIQQIQNQSFLSNLIAKLKPKGAVQAVQATSIQPVPEGVTAKSLIHSSTPKQTVSSVKSPTQIVVSKGPDAVNIPTKEEDTAVHNTQSLMVHEDTEVSNLTSEQTDSNAPITQTDNTSLVEDSAVCSVSTVLNDGSPPKQADASPGRTPVVIKPGQSYLAAVKPFLKLGTAEGKLGSQVVFDGYKLKSETVKEKISGEKGFAPIDMVKSNTKGNKKEVIKSASLVTPKPVVVSKPAKLTIEEPIKELIIPQKSPTKTTVESTTQVEKVITTPVTIKSSPKATVESPALKGLSKECVEKMFPKGSIVLSPSKTAKVPSNIFVVEGPVSAGRGKKANPLHVIADAAVSRLPVPGDDTLPQITSPSGRGRGRGRGKSVKQTATKSVLSKMEHIKTTEAVTTTLQKNSTETVKDDVKSPKSAERHKRSFMDAFNSPPDADLFTKERKVQPDDGIELTTESVVQAKTVSGKDDSKTKTSPTMSKTPESFVKPKGRPRKQTLPASPVTAEAPVTPVSSKAPVSSKEPQQKSSPVSNSGGTSRGRGRPRKQPSDVESVPKTSEVPETKAKERQMSPEPRGRGRPRKVSSDETPELPQGVVARSRKQSVESQVEPKIVSTPRRQSSDSTSDAVVTPKGRGRPRKESPSPTSQPKSRGRPPKQSPSRDVATKTPKVESLKALKKDATPAKVVSPQVKTNNSEIVVVSEVQYIGKYKIHPIERPNTRRGGQRVSSPGGPHMDAESPKSPAPADDPKPGKRRGRPPANAAKKAKTE